MLINKSVILSLFLVGLFAAPVSAQNDSGISIITRPPGATVYLNGETDLVAHTPVNLPANITGRFKVEITRPGYETWNGNLTFVPGSPNNIAIDLSKKTRMKAMLRSVLVPGWGQIYSGNKVKGYLFTGSVILSAAAVYHLDRRFDKKSADLDIARANYEAAMAIEDRIALKAILDDTQRDAYNAETDRNTAFAVGVALWGYNILDALVFFPEGEVYLPSVSSYGDGAALTFNFDF